MNSNALGIKSAVARYAVFHLRHIMVAIEPSFSAHDVWSLTTNRYQYEWEVKQSIADLRREAKKWKHRSGHILRPSFHVEGWPNRFFVVVPKAIAPVAERWISDNIPYAGLAVVGDHGQILVLRLAGWLHKERASLHRCARVSRWMAVSVADLLSREAGKMNRKDRRTM